MQKRLLPRRTRTRAIALFYFPHSSRGQDSTNSPLTITMEMLEPDAWFVWLHFGGGGWIRTTVGIASRFTVCPLWPLGNTPMRRRKLRIIRFRASAKAHSLRCSSFSNRTRFAGLRFDFEEFNCMNRLFPRFHGGTQRSGPGVRRRCSEAIRSFRGRPQGRTRKRRERSLHRRWSWWTDLNPRPADYKSAALPTELHQHDGEHQHER